MKKTEDRSKENEQRIEGQLAKNNGIKQMGTEERTEEARKSIGDMGHTPGRRRHAVVRGKEGGTWGCG